MKAVASEDPTTSGAYAVAGALLIVALVAAFAWLPRLFGSHTSEQIGRDAPAMNVPLLANAGDLVAPPALAPTTISLAELKGHAVILDFWATWCGPCQAEAPIVDRVATRFKSRGLVVIGVDTSDEDGRETAGPWAKAHGIKYPIAFDEGNRTAHAFAVENLPTLIIIDKAGKIIARLTGLTDGAEIERLVNQAL